MKVVVDYDLCEANALCMKSAPEIFRVEEDDTLTILMDVVPDNLKEKAHTHIEYCAPRKIGLAPLLKSASLKCTPMVWRKSRVLRNCSWRNAPAERLVLLWSRA